MCGITGQFNLQRNTQVNESQLRDSLQQLKKRGPDSQDIWIGSGVGLGHARLSIIDLNTCSNQPMHDSSRRYSIIFNGEIFNYKELRRQLKGTFHTQSDTEVLLQSYIQWKEKCLEKLNGFFSFVIYDHEEHSLFAARDRFGIKPFLYSFNDQSFYFASELKALLKYPIQKNISASAMNAFFQLSYLPGEQSIFQSVKRLLPGHYLRIQNGQATVDRYYSLGASPSSQLSFDEAKEKLKTLVGQAMDNWIESDAPLGAFLSGGIDSSIIVAIASQRIPHLKTFSVTFPDSAFHNEGPYALAVAKKYQTNHTEIPLTTENLYSCVDQVLEYLDEPFADSSAIPTFALSQQVGNKVRVALSGDGADEIFGGYEKYQAELLMSKWQYLLGPTKPFLPLLKKLPQSRDKTWSNQIRKANRFLSGLSLDDQERYLQWCSFVPQETVQSFLNPNFQDESWKQNLPFSDQKSFSGINRTLYRDSQMVLPNDMLTKVDLMSMANSLEVRPVFLDHRIADFIFTLPESYKVQASQTKKLLVETFKPLLPTEVYNRPKHGFTVELMPFFRNQFWEKLNDVYLNEKLIREQEIFDLTSIQAIKNKIKEGRAEDIQALVWSLITFQNFWIKFKPGNGLS